MTSSNPNYLPKGPSPNITGMNLEITFIIHELLGRHIQTIAVYLHASIPDLLVLKPPFVLSAASLPSRFYVYSMVAYFSSLLYWTPKPLAIGRIFPSLFMPL
jgi:hypothetical protein